MGGSQPFLSADGRWLAFQSGSGAFDARDTNGTADVFVYEISTGAYRLASVNHLGSASGSGFSENPVLSADGEVVVFESDAEDLVPTDGNGLRDVFVRNMTTGVTSLASRSLAGGGADRPSGTASVSADGRFVLFNTAATDISLADLNDRFDAYRFRIADGTVDLVSLEHTGTQSANCDSGGGALSPEGRLVLLGSCATDLVDTVFVPHLDDNVYVRDMVAGTTDLVSVNALGTAAGDDSSFMACVSSSCAGGLGLSTDGRYVVFSSWAKDLATDPIADACLVSPCLQVFVRDRVAGTTRMVSLAAGGVASGELPSDSEMISSDGAVVTFRSDASSLVAADTNGESDVFVDGEPSVAPIEVPALGLAGLLALAVGLAGVAAARLSGSGVST